MKLFKCQNCGQILYFENSVCEKCSHSLGYDPTMARLLALEPPPDQQTDDQPIVRRAVGVADKSYRFCSNASFGVCNWLIDAASPDAYCLCCRHNATVPDTSIPANLLHWAKIETLSTGCHAGGRAAARAGAGNTEQLLPDFLAVPKNPRRAR